MRYSRKSLERKFRNPKKFCSAVDCDRYGQTYSKFGIGGKPDPFVEYSVVPNSPNISTLNIVSFLTEMNIEITGYQKIGWR
jgi:hypothetical protein